MLTYLLYIHTYYTILYILYYTYVLTILYIHTYYTYIYLLFYTYLLYYTYILTILYILYIHTYILTIHTYILTIPVVGSCCHSKGDKKEIEMYIQRETE